MKKQPQKLLKRNFYRDESKNSNIQNLNTDLSQRQIFQDKTSYPCFFQQEGQQPGM